MKRPPPEPGEFYWVTPSGCLVTLAAIAVAVLAALLAGGGT